MSHAIPMHAIQHSSSSTGPKTNNNNMKKKKKRNEPKIRVILADGTEVPKIRAPTLLDKAKRFVPDRATTRHNLLEACRRTTLRRASRFYFVEGAEDSTTNKVETLQHV